MLNTKSLTDDELKTLKKKASDILSVCRRDILNAYPFIGSIALRMETVPTRDVRVRTACTDGNSVYFDIAFLSSLTREQQTFVLAHEVWHAVLMHLVRRQNRIPQLFNIATDKEVNAMLQKDGFTPPADLCFPTKEEEGKCAEEIYEMMFKDAKKRNNAGNSGNSKSNNAQQNNGTKGQGSGKNKSQSGSGGASSTSTGSGDAAGGNQNGDLTGQFDKHVYEGMEDGQNNSNGADQDGWGKMKITDKYGEVGFDSDYQPKVSKDFADKMRETIVSEAQRVEKMRGTLPSHIKALVKKVTSAELNWSELLAQFVTHCYNSGRRSWIPPNRRHIHNGIYLQSRQADKIRIACILDTSGSTCGDRGKFLAELNSLIKSFGLYDLWLIECDAAVGAIKHYTQDDYLEQEIENGEYTMTGGGGTELIGGFNAILEEGMEVDAVICLTDGYIDHIPNNPTNLPTLWVITKDGTEDFCDWGQKIKLKISDDNI